MQFQKSDATWEEVQKVPKTIFIKDTPDAPGQFEFDFTGPWTGRDLHRIGTRIWRAYRHYQAGIRRSVKSANQITMEESNE